MRLIKTQILQYSKNKDKKMQAFNMQKQTILKTNPISQESITYLQDKKRQLVLIAQPKSIHIYNIIAQKFEDEVKLPGSGAITCVTVSDDLFFFAYGMHIAAAGFNGKVVFDFDTYIASDKIDRIHVIGYRLWVFSGTILNEFMMAGSQLANKMSRKTGGSGSKVQDINSHMFQSNINGSIAVQDQFSKHYLIILKKNNQIISFQQKQLTSYKTNSPPTSIIQYPKTKPTRYLVGTTSGEILHLDIGKKAIKQIWAIRDNSKGRINCLLEVKNQCMFVFRDQQIQVWGQDRAILATEQTQQKYLSAIYLPQKEMLFAGSTSGNVTQMRDYTKMMKSYEKRNQAKIKQDLQKQIASLQAQYQSLKLKATSQKKIVTKNQGINVEINIIISYQNLCSCLEIKSNDSKISKIMVKGKLSIVKCSKLIFSQKQKNQQWTYVIQQQELNLSKVFFKGEQKFEKQQKIKVMVYGVKDGKIYGVTRVLDMKPLLYHHKIALTPISRYNQLKIGGQFKYFQMNMFMNMIFNQFGQTSQSGEEYSQACYQSILTKQKLSVKYKNRQCLIQSTNPSPLIVIKQLLVDKSQQKHLSLNYSIQLNAQSIKQLVMDLQNIIRPLQQHKRQAQLLPGIMEIQNDQALSQDLKNILNRRQQIIRKQKQEQNQYQLLVTQLKNVFISYKKLKDHDVTAYELDFFNRLVQNFDANKIISTILS